MNGIVTDRCTDKSLIGIVCHYRAMAEYAFYSGEHARLAAVAYKSAADRLQEFIRKYGDKEAT